MTFGLKENIIEKIIEILSDFPEVDEAIVYGSRARGNFRTGSDIDIVLKGEKLTLSMLNKIDLRLDNLLLPYTFDLSLYHHIKNPELKEHINTEGITLYKKLVNV